MARAELGPTARIELANKIATKFEIPELVPARDESS